MRHAGTTWPFATILQAATRRRWALLLAAILIVSAGWLGLASNRNPVNSADTEEALPVESLHLRQSAEIESIALYAGTIEASRSAELGFERAGRIARVLAEEGQAIAQGQALAQLDTAALQVQLKQAQSQLAQAEALQREFNAGPRSETIASARAQVREAEEQLRLARTQESRREDLLRREAISREEMDSFRTQVGALAARVDAARERLRELEAGTRREQLDSQHAVVELARARVEEVRVQLAKCMLVAPFSGRVAKRCLDEGAYANPGTPVIELIEVGRPEIRVGLPSEIALSLKVGERYGIRIAGTRHEAPVLRVLPELDEGTRVVSAIFSLPDAARQTALPGMLAEVEVPRRIDEASFRVPVSALTRADRGLWACYAIRQGNKQGDAKTDTLRVERREVEILHADEAYAYIRGLIEEGEQIVANGVNRVTEGQRVRIVKES